jgi:hypothetical protein
MSEGAFAQSDREGVETSRLRPNVERRNFSVRAQPIAGAQGHAALEARMQAAYGNQAVLRRLARRGDSADSSVCARLAVSQPYDPAEREADDMAEQALSSSIRSPADKRTALGEVRVDRLAADVSPAFEQAIVGGNEEEASQGGTAIASLAQLSRASGSGRDAEPIAADFSTRLASARSKGEKIAPEFGAEMSERFGANLRSVQVHRDREASELAADINARAFTIGSDIFFGAGEYSPQTGSGRKVLAHELAHVIQQDAAGPGSDNQPQLQRAGGEIQRLSHITGASAKVVRRDVYPWGGDGPRGDDYEVTTGAGNAVVGWVAVGPWRGELTYWCHGFALGTYLSDGYSIYSRDNMMRVVLDEWTPIAASAPSPGNIAVRLQEQGGPGYYDHSAIFTTVVLSSTGLDEDQTKLDSKNGQEPLSRGMSLREVKNMYPGTFGFFQRK